MKSKGLAALAILTPFLAACSPGGVKEAIWDLALTDDTVYAPGYTDEGFNSVTVGMSEREVLRRLGPPIDGPYFPQAADPDWDKGMRWTRSAHDSHYKIRVILFRQGRVADKHAGFYVD
jgi:hypothetical protein